jgi:hypothetical protein
VFEPHGVQASTILLFFELVEEKTEVTGAGERQVGFSGEGDVSEEFDGVTEVDHDEGRSTEPFLKRGSGGG